MRRKVKEAGEREMRQIRDRAQREIDRLDEVLDTFRKLDRKQLVTDELLYRELRDRFGEYFTGGMGAEAIKALLREHGPRRRGRDRCARPSARGKGQRKIRALKRLKVVAAFLNTAQLAARHGAGLRPGHPAGPASDGAARRWAGPRRVISMICTGV